MNIVQRARYINLLIQKRENYTLVLITEVKSEFPKIKKYNFNQIMGMKKRVPIYKILCIEKGVVHIELRCEQTPDFISLK